GGKHTTSYSSSVTKTSKTETKTVTKRSSISGPGLPSLSPTGKTQTIPLAPTQDDSDKLKEKGLTPKGMSERFMQTLRFLTPLSQDKDEGCDDYLNALGESGDGEQQLAADCTQTKVSEFSS
ncbi:hypothetical protein TELCIR_17038, partial [Teladorsagia circumcincta]